MIELKTKCKKLGISTFLLTVGMFQAAVAYADSADQARRLHQRLTGVPPTTAVLQEMKTLIESKKPLEAAQVAVKHRSFLNSTMFDFFAPMTNESENNRVVLTDFLATALGVVRDELSFKEALTGDIIYIAPNVAAWSPNNNTMYEQHVAAKPLDFVTDLQRRKQSEIIKAPLSLPDTFTDYSGLLTTREFAVQYYFDGTNRAALNYAFKSFICRDIEKLTDSTRSDHMVRQDVERDPGSNSTTYRTQCKGCHAGMDALGGAFAYFHATDVNGQLRYSITPGTVQPKYLQNASNYQDGYVTKDNSWTNLWSEGNNKILGWKGSQTGKGVKELAQLMVNTDAFPDCMARRAHSRVCMSSFENQDGKVITELAHKFVDSNFNLKNLFVEASITCLGE